MFTLGSGTIVAAPWVAACNPASIAGTYGAPVTIGEIGGDVEFDIQWQSKDFNGQSNFPIARGFYGGKLLIKAKKVEIYPANLSVFTNLAKTSGGGNDIYTGLNLSLPIPIFVKFVHTRSDVAAKYANVYLFKAYCPQLAMPFIREDISTMDLEFEAMADTSMTNKDLLRIEVTQ